jgi:hypothetical protein
MACCDGPCGLCVNPDFSVQALFLQIDWRSRFVFDFQLPSADYIYKFRKTRALTDSHPADGTVCVSLALYLHCCGICLVVRTDRRSMPRTIIVAGLSCPRRADREYIAGV